MRTISRFALLLVPLLVGATCGSVSPAGPGAGGSSGGQTTGAAGMAGGTGTAGASGTAGGAGSTGGAGSMGTAGATGTAGQGGASGRVPQKHRAAAVACSSDRPAGTCDPTNLNIPDAGFSCRKDADCAAGSNGRCSSGARVLGCQCTYDTCSTDADCAQMGGPCECRSSAQGIVAPTSTTTTNVCKAGNCRVDSDCGAGGYCSPSLGSCGNYSGVVGYYCHAAKDQCLDDADCATQGGGDCRYDPPTGAWACATSQCAG